MKNNVLKYYITAFYLCSTFTMFAIPGSGNDEVEEEDALEAADAVAAPIDDYLWVLALIGLVFIFMKYRAMQNQKVNS